MVASMPSAVDGSPIRSRIARIRSRSLQMHAEAIRSWPLSAELRAVAETFISTADLNGLMEFAKRHHPALKAQAQLG